MFFIKLKLLLNISKVCQVYPLAHSIDQISIIKISTKNFDDNKKFISVFVF